MKTYKDLRLYQGTDKWKKWRKESGIGGSEIASVLATDSRELAELVYTPPIKLHLQKIGEPVQEFTGNVPSMEGQFQERGIIERFKWWDLERPDNLGMHKNRIAGNVLNKVYNINCVFWNKDYPWLFYSPDALLMKGRKRQGILESKLTTSMETRRYVNKLNPAFYFQVQTGLFLTGLEIGYALLLIDGQWFEVIPIEPDKEVHQWIEYTSAQFWTNVVKARKIKEEYGITSYFLADPETFSEKQRDGIQMLSELEPHLTGNERELDFIRAMIVPQPERNERRGTEQEKELCRQYREVTGEIKELMTRKNDVYGRLLLQLNGCNVVTFDQGYYSYLPDKNGKPSLYVKI